MPFAKSVVVGTEEVMVNVRTCGYGCGYQTNVKGDLSRHVKEKHTHKARWKTPAQMYVRCPKCDRVMHVLNDGYGSKSPCSVCRPQISYK